jgi:DNA-binding GntR family transcriptional regulator
MNVAATPLTGRTRRVRREQLSDEVAAHLRYAIMSGSLRPGTFIRLEETAASLGVSNTPVREALRTLRGEGMVQLEPHRGHVVVPLSRADVEDIFWLQATIAKELAASATALISDDEIAELGQLNDAMAEAVERRDPELVSQAVFAFHRTLNRSTGRIKLAWFLLHAARNLPPLFYANDPQWGVRAVANHRELTAALRRRDAQTVVRLTDAQFTDGARRLTARLEEIGLWS